MCVMYYVYFRIMYMDLKNILELHHTQYIHVIITIICIVEHMYIVKDECTICNPTCNIYYFQ